LAEEKKKDDEIMSRLFAYNKPEKGYYYAGVFLALGNGVCFPLVALVMAEMIYILSMGPDSENYRKDVNRLTYYFIGIAFGALVCFGGMMILFARVGEGLTYRLRKDGFDKIMRMPISWFDKAENNPGTLAVRLGSEAKEVNSLTSNIIGL
jgi:ABC-type multidrug transport system fused ATPase/permease subunit